MTLLLLTSLQGAVAPTSPSPAGGSSLLLGPYDLLAADTTIWLARGSAGEFDRGAAAPATSVITSELLDGGRVVGDRSDNRQIRLPLFVDDPDPLLRAAKVNTILRLVNSATFPLTWTPAGGLPVVYDCFRGTATLTTAPLDERQGVQGLDVVCPALPYGRSPAPVSVPLVGTPVRLHSFDILPNAPGIYPGWRIVAAGQEEGTGYLEVAPFSTFTGLHAGSTLTDTFGNDQAVPLNLGGMTVVSLRIRPHALLQVGQLTLTLLGQSGQNYQVEGTVGAAPPTSSWVPVRFPLPAATNATSGRLTGGVPELVTGWRLSITVSLANYLPAQIGLSVLDVDDLIAYPAASAATLTPRGGVYLLADVPGSARAPISLAMSLPSGAAFRQWLIHRPPADQPNAIPIIPVSGPSGTVGTAPGSGYRGTYTVFISVQAAGASQSLPRTLTATFTQAGASSTPISMTVITPFPGLVRVGTVSLPIAGQPPDAASTLTVQVASSVAADTIGDVLLVDTRGETIFCSPPKGSLAVWIDEPTPLEQAPAVYGTSTAVTGRADAVSLAGSCLPLTDPISVDPGPNQLLVYAPDGAPTAVATFAARWLQEADR